MSIHTFILVVAIIVFAVIPTLKERQVSIARLFVSPLLFLYLFTRVVDDNFTTDAFHRLIITLGMVCGTALGIALRWNTVMTPVGKNKIKIPGSLINLTTFLFLFVIHTVIEYTHAVNPVRLSQDGNFAATLLFILAFFSTISLGANMCLYSRHVMRTANV